MANKLERGSIATPLTAVLFIAVAMVVFGDTMSYTDSDSFVFPRAISTVLVGLSVISILRWLLFPSGERLSFDGSKLRRVGLVVTMLGATMSMPWLGFLFAALLAYGAILLLAMYDPWTPKRLLVYPLAGAGVVVGFYLLFSKALLVPLPVGAIFGG